MICSSSSRQWVAAMLIVYLTFDQRQVDLAVNQRPADGLSIADADLELGCGDLPRELRSVARQPVARDGGAGADDQSSAFESDARAHLLGCSALEREYPPRMLEQGVSTLRQPHSSAAAGPRRTAFD